MIEWDKLDKDISYFAAGKQKGVYFVEVAYNYGPSTVNKFSNKYGMDEFIEDLLVEPDDSDLL